MKPPFCCNLRTKAMYIPAEADKVLNATPEESTEAFYWCLCSGTRFGPDGQPAEPPACKPDRSCFQE